jgi:hypothetical protein
MLLVDLLLGVAAIAASASAKEQAPNDAKAAELYDSGIMMERIMMKKEVR